MPSQALPTSQVAWQLSQPGAPLEDHLQLNQTAPVPQLKSNQTLVRVLSASLNPADYKVLEPSLVGRLIVGWPMTPAMDYVGRVWSTTLPDSAGFKAGDLVFGNLSIPSKHGSLGQFMVVTGTANMAHVPDLRDAAEGVDLDGFAAIGIAGLTAYQCLIPCLGSGPGQGKGKSVFINGGSGGTGVYGIQIAKKILGCDDVVVSCSAANADLCKSLGADEVIDYRSQDVVEGLKSWVQRKGKKFDLFVDNVSADLNMYWQCHHYLTERGRFTQVGGAPNFKTVVYVAKILLWPGFLGGGKRKYLYYMLSTDRDGLSNIGKWTQEGKIKAVLDTTFPHEDAPKAFKKLKTGRARGKIIVRVNEDGR